MRGLGNADRMAAAAMAKLAKRPQFKRAGERIDLLSLLLKARPYLFKVVKVLFYGKSEGVTEQTTALINDYIAQSKARLGQATSPQEKLDTAIFDLQAFFGRMLDWVPQLVAGGVSTALLHGLMKQPDAKDDLAAIGRGLTGNVATAMNLAVGDLADLARASDTLLATLSQADKKVQTRLGEAAHLSEAEPFLAAWQQFLKTYGARGPSEIDLSRPRWSEEPGSLLQMVVSASAQSELGAHRKHHQKLVCEGEEASKRLVRKAYKSWWGFLRGPLVRRFIRLSRNLMPLREHHKFFAIRGLALLKPVLQDVGADFYKAGRLKSAEDIWFLGLPEILDALGNAEQTLIATVTERKGEFRHYQSLTPPRVITSEGEIPPLSLQVETPEGALIGSPVSPGMVEGAAKVVLDPARESLKPGEILVAPFTDPGWTPLFVNAAGLVTEVGGLMTHGSLVAREYGIPAVVGVVDATKQIKTGQRLRVHGDAGYVEILSEVGTAKPVALARDPGMVST